MNRKEYQKKYIKEWRKKNSEEVKRKERERYHSKSQEWKDAQVLKNKNNRRKTRLEALEYYGGKCACCGETEILFLCIDHMNNNGSEHRKIMSDKSIGVWLKRNNYPKGFQVLCHNCNMAKGIYGKCPHKRT